MFFRKKKETKAELELPFDMALVSYTAIKGFLSECDNPVPDYALKAHWRDEIDRNLMEDFRRRLVPMVKEALKKSG